MYQLNHGYNGYGVQDNLTYPIERLKVYFAPTTLGQPTMVCANPNPGACGKSTSYAYAVQQHPNGALQFFNYGNGIQHILQQNLRGLPLRAIDDGVINDGYSYDAAGNVVNIGDAATANHVGTRGIDYDALQRVYQVRAPNLWGTIDYRYDGLDNLARVSVTGLAGGVPARTDTFNYDYATNRLAGISSTATANNISYGYDARSNISTRTRTQVGTTQGFSFDLGNRLKQAPGVATYLYDGHGRLVSTVNSSGNTIHVYDQSGALVYARPPSGVGTSYLRLGHSVVAQVRGSNVAYVHTDGLGSTIATSNSNGSVNPRTLYEPFGAKAAGPDQDLGFTGHLNTPELSLVYMQQRYYDPLAGRFLSVDPVTVDASTGSNFNRYNYASNSPYRYIDADGRIVIDVVFVIYDIYALATEGATVTNVVALGLDLASTGGFGFGAGGIYRASHAVEAVAHGAEAAAHGSVAAVHGAEAGVAKETGSYTNFHESGKTYSGKGSRERSQVSGKRVEKQTGDRHVATEWKQSKNSREAFKDESKRIDANGGVKSADTYNKVESPGKKYLDQDGQ